MLSEGFSTLIGSLSSPAKEIVILLFIAYLFYRRWLKHKERITEILFRAMSDMNNSNNQSPQHSPPSGADNLRERNKEAGKQMIERIRKKLIRNAGSELEKLSEKDPVCRTDNIRPFHLPQNRNGVKK